jgi:hypothetical protein
VCGIFEGGNANTLTHCFEVLSVGFRILEGGNGNGTAAQAQCGKVLIGQACVVSVFVVLLSSVEGITLPAQLGFWRP